VKRYPRGLTIKSVDSNHHEIISEAREAGIEILDTHVIGRGFPDCIPIWRGDFWLVEIKTETGKLTDAERAFALRSKTPVHIVRSLDDLLKLVGAIA
jgi:hypothetical protein